jgi:UDP-N-acetylmuramyl pentapeptide phosphotransferase/UDP-N-acetylglucosamine-1-phosphate transferase
MKSGAAIAIPVAFIVALVAIEFIRRSPLARILVDRPNERSLHQAPTPRIGGLGLLVGAIAAMAVMGMSTTSWIAMVAMVLAAISAADDAESLPVATRLATHLGAAALALAVIGPSAPLSSGGSLGVAFVALLAITWMANLFNFMDGADGQAGSMAAIGFAALALTAHRAGAEDLVVACAAIAAASLAFLVFNFPPARVFMGDAGSVPLGFLAGALGWQGAVRGAWPAWFPALVFSPFIVDATLTLARRLLAGEPVWKAHRSHYYQRLVLGGWSHRRLLLAQWVLMMAAAASAIVACEQSAMLQRAILAAWVVAYGVMAVVIDSRHPRKAIS